MGITKIHRLRIGLTEVSALFTFLLESTAFFSFFGSIFCLESGPLPPPETPAFWSSEVSITSSQLSKRLLAVTKESSDEELVIEPIKNKQIK